MFSLLLLWLMSDGKAITNLQSACLPVHYHTALNRFDHAGLCPDFCLYHSHPHFLFSIPIILMLHLSYRHLANGKRAGVVELRVLMGRRHGILHSLLADAVGHLLKNGYPRVDLHSGWSYKCHWCSRCYMTW